MNIKKALQTIESKSRQGNDVTEDLQALIEALDLEEQIGKLNARLEKATTRFETNTSGRGRRRTSPVESSEAPTDEIMTESVITP